MSSLEKNNSNEEEGLESKDEFDDADDVAKVYCKQISEEDYENQGITTTDNALKDLMGYLDNHPDEFEEMLKKRKRQDLENGGMISFLKVKVMDVIHGGNSPLLQVSTKEREKKLREMKQSMMKAFDYSLESKGRRVSKRLEEKREKKATADMEQKSKKSKKGTKTSSGIPPPPPPPPLLSEMPPPPPPPPCQPVSEATTPTLKFDVTPRRPFRPLEQRLNGRMVSGPDSVKKGDDANDSFGSIAPVDCSLTSLHQELLSSNPWKRLKCVDENRSPGGTPSNAKKALKMDTPKEPLYVALMDKFKNIRSPSPNVLGNTTLNNTADFTSDGFTP